VERADGGAGRRVVRVTCEILRPVPIGVFDVHAEVVRPGKSVDLVEARLSDDDGPLILARGWRIRVAADASPPTDETSRPPSPDGLPSSPFFETGHNVGYHTAMDVRFVRGGFREAGPATVWMRMKVPLVAGEEPTPLVRVLVAADSGNGVSAVLDPARHLFINTDLTVHLLRHPVGSWVCLDAETRLAADGVGMAVSTIHDESGHIGNGLQSLLIAPRPPRPDVR
jgi:hypothetical protein